MVSETANEGGERARRDSQNRPRLLEASNGMSVWGDLVAHNIGMLEFTKNVNLADQHTLFFLAHAPIPNLFPHQHLSDQHIINPSNVLLLEVQVSPRFCSDAMIFYGIDNMCVNLILIDVLWVAYALILGIFKLHLFDQHKASVCRHLFCMDAQEHGWGSKQLGGSSQQQTHAHNLTIANPINRRHQHPHSSCCKQIGAVGVALQQSEHGRCLHARVVAAVLVPLPFLVLPSACLLLCHMEEWGWIEEPWSGNAERLQHLLIRLADDTSDGSKRTAAQLL